MNGLRDHRKALVGLEHWNESQGAGWRKGGQRSTPRNIWAKWKSFGLKQPTIPLSVWGTRVGPPLPLQHLLCWFWEALQNNEPLRSTFGETIRESHCVGLCRTLRVGCPFEKIVVASPRIIFVALCYSNRCSLCNIGFELNCPSWEWNFTQKNSWLIDRK